MSIKLFIEFNGMTHERLFEGTSADLERILQPACGPISRSNPDPTRELEEVRIFIQEGSSPTPSEVAKVKPIYELL